MDNGILCIVFSIDYILDVGPASLKKLKLQLSCSLSSSLTSSFTIYYTILVSTLECVFSLKLLEI
uniref:Ovule protein n=1 Tax=Romanomermis culicivorax TaxID=13658 RepID=A0A915K0H4_ROMCU